MNHNTIALGVCGTFGSPNGFQQCFYQPTPFSRSLDLDSKSLEVCAGAPLFMLRRDGATETVCLAAYSSAREPQSSRRGTFIGSALVLPAGHFSAEALQSLIEELHNDVISAPQNLVDGVLQVSEAVALTVAEPHTLKAAEESLQAGRQQSVSVMAGQVALVSGTAGQLARFLEWSFRYFPHYDTLYFTANADTQRSVDTKGLVPVLTWKQFESEKEALVAEEKAAIRQAQELERQASQKPKRKSSAASSDSSPFELWESGAQWSRSEREQRIEEHNNLLRLYHSVAAQLQKAAETGSIVPAGKEKHRKKRRLNLYKMAFWILLTLLIVGGSYWAITTLQQRKEAVAEALALADRDKFEHAPLDPAPTANLDSATRALLFPQGLRGWSADSVTSVMYAQKPDLTAEYWPRMQSKYRNALVAGNSGCFVGSGTAFYCICDTLAFIPVHQEGILLPTE
jgi:hypothetical protein